MPTIATHTGRFKVQKPSDPYHRIYESRTDGEVLVIVQITPDPPPQGQIAFKVDSTTTPNDQINYESRSYLLSSPKVIVIESLSTAAGTGSYSITIATP